MSVPRSLVMTSQEILKREPDYWAMTKNCGLDMAAALLNTPSVFLRIGGLALNFDFSEYKSLPYKTPSQEMPSSNAAISS